MSSLEHRRHTLAHLLAAAVSSIYPEALPTIGPSIEHGFYYDFDFLGTAPKEEDLKKLENRVRTLLPTWEVFTHQSVTADEAREHFRSNPYKLELIAEIEKAGETITLYTCGGFTDLCRGGHAEYPSKEIDPESFTLDRLAGAYWRGDEKNKMLTRIYGLAFNTREELSAHLQLREEAEKRDHRKIGKELDLFTFSELIGGGLPLFTPKGTVLREEIHNYSQALRLARGFERVWIPHITKTDLYKTSGHWAKFGHELFLVKSQETSDEFVLKPMNCPHHTQIYASRPRSYRDLPIRYLETTTVYRDEKTGELSGLSRVRAITQDDSHIFCRQDQVEAEYRSIMEMVSEFYATMGMKFRARLSFHDTNAKEKYLGDESLWKYAEERLESIAKQGSFEYFIAEGEAAFYGPKIDFMATDALGREHQLATAQLDFVQPERFGLEYTNTDGTKKMPVMIHLAIAGSLERFLSVYIEHTAGVFPTWLSPVQVRVLSIAEAHAPFATSVVEQLKSVGMRVELDDSNETLGKKVRSAKQEKIPYFLVIGDEEVRTHTATLEGRSGKLGSFPIEEIAQKLQKEIISRT